MRKSLFLLCLLAIVWQPVSAQHTISGTLQGENNDLVTLYAYTGQELKALDSTYTNQQGGFSFDVYLETGMYVVETQNVSIELL